jgi:hypothetical protein
MEGMPQTMQSTTFGPAAVNVSVPFVDRRNPPAVEQMPVCERRQFGNSYEELSPEAAELAHAIDQYKLSHRRRFITFEEMLAVVKSLGYRR